ncbi:hypothetical protein DPMN_165598, partial [Dreissena polymorpha]
IMKMILLCVKRSVNVTCADKIAYSQIVSFLLESENSFGPAVVNLSRVCTDLTETYETGGDLCVNESLLADVTYFNCNQQLWQLNYDSNCSSKNEVLACATGLLDKYGSCIISHKPMLIKRALVNSAEKFFLTGAANCFRNSRNGTCPLAQLNYFCRSCSNGGEVNECVLDDECPAGKLCCHDGCSKKCVNNSPDPYEIRDKEGDCPVYSFDWSNVGACCSDLSCSGNKRCCPMPNPTCLEPLKVPSCNDTATLLGKLQPCGLSLAMLSDGVTLESLSCGTLFEKVTCLTNELNKDRPLFGECSRKSVKNTFLKLARDYNINFNSPSVVDCQIHQVIVTISRNSTRNRRQLQPRPGCSVTDEIIINQYQLLFQQELERAPAPTAIRTGDIQCDGSVIIFSFTFFTDMDIAPLYSFLYDSINTTTLNVSVIFNVMPENLSGLNRCEDNRTINAFAEKCALEAADTVGWRQCSIAIRFHQCMGRISSIMDNTGICYMWNMTDKMQQHIFDHLQSIADIPVLVVTALQQYNRTHCETTGDENPCYSPHLLNTSYDECSDQLATGVVFNFTDNANEIYGITAPMCRLFYEMTSCVFVKLRSIGGDCHPYSTEQDVYEMIRRKELNGHYLPTSSYTLDSCLEHQPVCNSLYIFKAKWIGCYNTEQLYNNTCQSSSERNSMKNFLSCVSTNAVLNNESCLPSSVADLIMADTKLFGLLNTQTQFSQCVTDAELTVLDAQYDGEVCTMQPVLVQVSKSCMSEANNLCPQMLSTIAATNPNAACSFLTATSECVRRSLQQRTNLSCDISSLLNVTYPQYWPLHLPQDIRATCIAQVQQPVYETCYKDGFYSNINATLFCVTPAILGATQSISSQHLCRLQDYGLACLTALASSSQAQCLRADVHEAFQSTLAGYSADISLQTCGRYVYLASKFACQAPATLPEVNCNSTQLIADVVTVTCLLDIRKLAQNFTGGNVSNCLLYNALIECGKNASMFASRAERQGCSDRELKVALQAHSQQVKNVTGINTTICQSQCYDNLNAIANNCTMDTYIMYSYYLSINACSAFTYTSQCIHRRLLQQNGGQACDPQIAVSVARNIPAFQGLDCPDPFRQELDVCDNTTIAASVAIQWCQRELEGMYAFTTTLNGPCRGSSELEACIQRSLRLYSLPGGCLNNQEHSREVIHRVVMQAASALEKYQQGYLALLQNCFGRSQREGFCPVPTSSSCDVYSGNWSIQNNCTDDDDCMESGQKCCYDGCKLRCLQTAFEKAKYLVNFHIRNETYPLTTNRSYEVFFDQLFGNVFPGDRVEFNGLERSFENYPIFKFYLWTFRPVTYQILPAVLNSQTGGSITLYFTFQPDMTIGSCGYGNYSDCGPSECRDDYTCRYRLRSSRSKCCYNCKGYCALVEESQWQSCTDMTAMYNDTQDFCVQERDQLMRVASTTRFLSCRRLAEYTSCMTNKLLSSWRSECSDMARNFSEHVSRYLNQYIYSSGNQGMGFYVNVDTCRRSSCYNVTKIQEAVLNSCFHGVTQFAMVGQMNATSCQLLLNVSSCVREALYRINYSDYDHCNVTDLYHVVRDLVREMMPNMTWINGSICDRLVCFSANLERFKTGSTVCASPWSAYMANLGRGDNCVNFENFITCLQTQAVARNQSCPAQSLVSMVTSLGYDYISDNPLCSDLCNLTWSSDNGNSSVVVNVTLNPRMDIAQFTVHIPATSTSINMAAANKWLGIGVNTRNQMIGTDAYTIETLNAVNYTVKNRYASQRSTPAEDYTVYANVSVRHSNGETWLTFNRSISGANPAPNDQALNSMLYMVAAHGSISSGQISQHSVRYTSSQPFNFTCPTRFAILDARLPDTTNPMAVCSHVPLYRDVLQYQCKDFSYNMLDSRETC